MPTAAGAEHIAARLRQQGYEAVVRQGLHGDATVYRVRIGSYSSIAEAKHMADRIRRGGGAAEAFVTSD